jgi:hypothetical protein
MPTVSLKLLLMGIGAIVGVFALALFLSAGTMQIVAPDQ